MIPPSDAFPNQTVCFSKFEAEEGAYCIEIEKVNSLFDM